MCDMRNGYKERGRDMIQESVRKRVFDIYGGRCIYCGKKAECIDHIVPYAYSQDNHEDNLIASCNRCNLIAHDKVFASLLEKQQHVRSMLDKKKKYSEKKTYWTYDELDELGDTLRSKILSDKNVVIIGDEKDRPGKAEPVQRKPLL